MVFLAAARYFGTTPSMISMLARPRIDKARAWPGALPASMARAMSGCADSAATFGEVVGSAKPGSRRSRRSVWLQQ
jgi:hypothetical protein